MRLRRSFLLLAAGLSAAASADTIYVDTTTPGGTLGALTVTSTAALGTNDFLIGDADLTINLTNGLGAPISATFTGHFKQGATDGGRLVKTGGGTLQYDGFNDNEVTYFHNHTFSLLSNPIPTPVDLRADSLNAFSGTILVQQGQLQVSGAINQWSNYGGVLPVNNGMLGASQVILASGTTLSFQNTQLNLVGALANLTGSQANTPSTPLVARLNFVNNVQGTADSEVNVGKTDEYILVAHSDFAARGLGAGESAIGVLSGKGRFYKTGTDALVVRGNSTFTGEIVLADGATRIESANGDSFWSGKSVNLASVGASQGTNTPWRPNGEDGQFWKPGYSPDAGTASLSVSGTQHIRNFQSLFGETGIFQPILPGTGRGTTVNIATAADTLRITQETNYDGYYRGSFLGLGTLVKDGAGTLALQLDANNLPRVDVNAGKLIANVQSLGSGVINIAASAQLSLFQNDAGALRAEIRATSSLAELRFKPTDSIYYRGSTTATTVGNTDAGVADIVRAQTEFHGGVYVEDGTAIVFSAGNNNAFLNASTIQLLNGPSGRETSIRFNDTNQIVNNLGGDAYTRIFLGRGNITLGITAASTFQGGIEGVGNLVKQGGASFTLAGANTYFGATIVQQGGLGVSGANGIRNTSGLILAAPAATFSGNGAQSLGSLFGRAGTTVTVGGSLTVGVSADLRARLDTELLNLPVTVPPVSPAYYLATETTDSVVGFSPVTTLSLLVQQYNLNDTITADGVTDAAEALAFLDSVTVDGTVDAAEVQAHRSLLGFAGTLNLGTGGLTKVGIERLILSGTANYTGLTTVDGGILEIGIDTLRGTSGIALGRDGTLALDLATDRSYTVPITGNGTFQKLGAGRLDLDAASSAFTGVYDVRQGILAVTYAPTSAGATTTTQGSANLSAGATFIAKVASNLDWTGQVYGTGTFVKTGAGVLTLTTGFIFHDGLTDVQQGGIVAHALTAGDLHLAAGTTFVDDVADNPLLGVDDYYTKNITGTGHLTKSGLGDLRIEAAQTFAGKLTVAAGSLTLVAADAFSSASTVEILEGATLVLANGGAQSLGNVSAGAGSTIQVDVVGTDLTLNVPAGGTREFLGHILGFPDLFKTGAGKLSLIRPADSANELNSLWVQAGELEASQAAIGGATIDIAGGATLRFFADTGATDVYTVAITGTGSIAKSGAGTVDLSGATLTAANTSIDVGGGTLIVSETGLGAGRAPVVTLANGATFEYLATNDATFGVGNFSGAGNVTFGRTGTDLPVITLTPNGLGTTGYTGLTTVRTGVTLKLGNGFTALGGIATETGSTLDLSAITALTITQSVDSTFAGSLVGTANLTFAGSSTLTVTSNGGTFNGYLGNITVNGGTLALDLANTKSIALANGGTLSLRGDADNYTGPITGSGAVVLEDGVDIDLTAGTNAATTSLGSSAITRLALEGGAHLTADFTAGSVVGSTPIQLDGGLLTATGTGAISLALATPAATPGAANGASGLELTGTAAYTVTGRVIGDLSVAAAASATYLGAPKVGATPPADITGDVDVAGSLTLGASGAPVTLAGSLDIEVGGTLGGGWTLAGTLTNSGTLAPGFSPAHVTVGDLDNNATLQMELSSASEDQIAFSGGAILNHGGTGRLELIRYGAGHSYGVRHVILKDTVSPGAGSYVTSGAPGEDPRFNTVLSTGTSATALRYLLVYPTQLQGGPDGILGNADDTQDVLRSLAKDGEVAVYEVRTRAEYACPDAPAHVLDWVKDITEVNMTETALGSGEWVSSLGAGFTALGARLATLGDLRLCDAIDNFSPLGQHTLATLAVTGVRADQAAIARRLEQRRFDMAGTTVKGSEWFIDAIGGRTTVDAGPTASVTGASAGFIRDVGFDGYLGFNLGLDSSKGSLGGASVSTNGFRLGVFGGILTDDRTLALDAGLTYASLSGDINHRSVFDTNNAASANANTVSGWIRASSAVALDSSWSFTPFAQLETSSTKLASLSESGQVDALTVEDATLNETSLSLGFGIQDSWVADRGGWRYRLSLDVAYFNQLSGDSLSLTSGIPAEGLALYGTERRVLPGSGFSFAPTFTFGPDPDSTCTIGLRFDQASDGNATTWQVGYRKRF